MTGDLGWLRYPPWICDLHVWGWVLVWCLLCDLIVVYLCSCFSVDFVCDIGWCCVYCCEFVVTGCLSTCGADRGCVFTIYLVFIVILV